MPVRPSSLRGMGAGWAPADSWVGSGVTCALPLPAHPCFRVAETPASPAARVPGKLAPQSSFQGPVLPGGGGTSAPSQPSRGGGQHPWRPCAQFRGGGGPPVGVSWAPQPPEMSPAGDRTKPPRSGQGSGCRWGTRAGTAGAVASAPRREPGAQLGPRRGGDRRAGPRARRPRRGPGGSERGRRCKCGHRGGRVPRRTPSPRVPAPRRTALPSALPDRASGPLAGLFASAEAPGPVGARRRRVGRGRGRC